jgi:hypothetical protein
VYLAVNSGLPSTKYGFFKFGQSVVHVSGGPGLIGAYVLEDDRLAQTISCGQRLTLTIDSHDTNGAVTGSVAFGRWFPAGCPGEYLTAGGNHHWNRQYDVGQRVA